jgi:hypothetical protein
MADLRISELQLLAGGDLAAGDLLPIADLSASETKKITVVDLVGRATTLIADATIPNAKILFRSASIPGSALVNGAVTATQLGNNAVTAAKLGDESTVDLVTALPGTGAFTGQFALDITNDKAYIWDGSQWVSFKASGSVNEVIGSSAGIVNISVTTSGDQVTIATGLDATTGAAEFLGGPTGNAGAVGYRQIVGTDLPTATATTKGAVIVDGEGLRMNGDNIVIDNDIIDSATAHLVAYNSKGLVLTGRAIAAGDLPAATPSAKGGVIVGTGLSVDGTGLVNHTNNVISGSGAKVSFDTEGHVTGTLALDAADIPALDASKITAGAFDAARIANGSITKEKFANYATTVIQEADPGAGVYIGQFWYRESDAQLRTWSANSWIPVGFGRLSEENLRFCGTFDAATGSVTQITTFGTAAGLTAGAAIPAATTPLTGAYLVATKPGTYNTDVYDNGDWVLCIGTQWIRVDTLSSAGGGSTLNLGDLLNVTLTTPQSGDSLIFDASTNTWKNRSTHGVKITLIEAFDGARTSFTTSRQVVSENNLIVSVGGVIQEPGVDFTAPAGGNAINFLAAPPAGSDYWILQEASVDSGGGGGGGGTTLSPGTAAEEYLKWNSTLLAWQPSNTLDGGGY